jgi:hypothetical protein
MYSAASPQCSCDGEKRKPVSAEARVAGCKRGFYRDLLVAPLAGNAGQELLGDIDDHLVDLADDNVLDAGVAQRLADNAAIAAALRNRPLARSRRQPR